MFFKIISLYYSFKLSTPHKMTPNQALKEHPMCFIACILVIVGALNWLTIGFVGYNFVEDLFGKRSNIIYSVVGLAGLYMLVRKIMWLTK